MAKFHGATFCMHVRCTFNTVLWLHNDSGEYYKVEYITNAEYITHGKKIHSQKMQCSQIYIIRTYLNNLQLNPICLPKFSSKKLNFDSQRSLHQKILETLTLVSTVKSRSSTLRIQRYMTTYNLCTKTLLTPRFEQIYFHAHTINYNKLIYTSATA